MKSKPITAVVVIALTLFVAAAAPASTPESGSAAAAKAGSNWSMYLYDFNRDDYDSAETAINPRTASSLKQRWAFKAGGGISTQVSVVGGVAYWGSWDGLEHASYVRTGKPIWHTYLGQETSPGCFPVHIGVGSSAALATVTIDGKPTLVDFVGGGDGAYFALNASNGHVIWSHSFGTPQTGFFSWSSPVFYRGSVYLGVASIGDCPLGPGSVVKFNPSTGAIQADLPLVPAGCLGAGVWGSPTIDTATGDVYVATGNDSGACGSGPEPYAQAMVRLSPDLTPISWWRIPNSQAIGDSDFGVTPTLFTARIHGVEQQMVGAMNKSGIYYAFNRNEIANGPVWETPVISTNEEEVSSSAFNGSGLYVAGGQTTIGHRFCWGTIRDLNPGTGKVVWLDCLPGGQQYPAVAATPGMVWVAVGSIFYGVRSTTGQILFRRQEASGAYYYGPPSFTGNMMLLGSPDGWLREFVPSR